MPTVNCCALKSIALAVLLSAVSVCSGQDVRGTPPTSFLSAGGGKIEIDVRVGGASDADAAQGAINQVKDTLTNGTRDQLNQLWPPK